MTMEITRDNYGIFILDYHERRLSKEMISELMMFLDQNPGLQKEFEDFENISIAPDLNILFDEKKSLKRNEILQVGNIGAENYESYFIADHEGELNPEESRQIKSFLQKNPPLKRDYELFYQTFLQPDRTITFGNKNSLKKYPFAYRNRYAFLSAAAVFTLLIASYFIIKNINLNKPETTYNLAQTSKVIGIEPEETEYVNIPSSKEEILETNKYKVGDKEEPNRLTITAAEPVSIAVSKVEPIKLQNLEIEESNAEIICDVLIDKYQHHYPDNIHTHYYKQESYFASIIDQKQKKESNLLSRFVKGRIENALEATGLIKEDDESKLSLWTLADVSLDGFNALAETNLKLKREKDASGKLISMALMNDNLPVFNKNKSDSN